MNLLLIKILNYAVMKKILLFLFFINLCSCQLIKDEEFSFRRQPYYGQDIKIEGYYKLMNGEYPEMRIDNDTSILFFYDNGIVFFFFNRDSFR